ncbi:MAG: M56 family metallopeptidase [Acidobacteriota bacterium]
MDHWLNWLWQGGVVALAAALTLRALHPARNEARAAALWAALVGILALPAVPLVWALTSPAAIGTVSLPSTPPSVLVEVPARWWSSNAFLLIAWAFWILINVGRGGWALRALARARRDCRPFPAHLERQLTHWNVVKTGRRRARLTLSDDVRLAAVMGGAPPIIGVSPALLTTLDAGELDRVIVHEWAHVQRRDDLAAMLHLGVHVLAGWHPAVWWCRRQLEIEREVACDASAVNVTGSAKGYASALVKLASLVTGPVRPVPSVGALSSSALSSRIIRVLAHDGARRSWKMKAIGASVSLLGVTALVGGVRGVAAIAPPAITTRAMELVAAVPLAANRLILWTAPASPVRTIERRPDPRSMSGHREGAARRHLADTQATEGAPAASPPVPDAARTETLAPGQRLVGGTPAVDESADERRAAPLAGTPLMATAVTSPVYAERTTVSEASLDTPWSVAADGGVALGRGSQKVAVATAGFFSRFGRRVAGAF